MFIFKSFVTDCMSSNQQALKKYANQIRKRAEEVDNDKYLLAIADAIEKGNRQLSAVAEGLIQTRYEHLKLASAKVADTVNNSSEIKDVQNVVLQLNKRLQLVEIAFQKQTDLFVALFGITKEDQDTLNKLTDKEPQSTEEEVTEPVEEVEVPEIDETDTTADQITGDVDGVEEFKPGK